MFAGVKRRRTGTGAVPGSSNVRKAIAINRKINARFPYARYGRAYYERGTPANLADFGATYASATPQQKATRKMYGYVGRGLYSGRGAYGVRKFARDVNRLGRLVPKPVREALVDKAVQQIQGAGLYSGRGCYDPDTGKITANNLISGGRPSMQISGSGDETQGFVITHKEFLQDIYGPATSGFSIEGWQLNPSLVENFPWLSQLAMNYEEYEFIQLVFEFRSTIDASAVNNPAGNTGSLMMATNYNPTAPLFTSKEQMMQYHGCSSGRLVEDHCHGVECDPDKNAGSAQKYTRTNPVQTGQDIKTFDLGQFQLAMTNVPTAFQNQQVGELWVYYTVRLDKPRLYGNLGAGILENRYVSNGYASGSLFNAIMGNNMLSMQQNVLPISVTQTATAPANLGGATSGTDLSMTFPDFITGVFEVQLWFEGSALSNGVMGWLEIGSNFIPYKDMYAMATTGGTSPYQGTYGCTLTQGFILGRYRFAPTTNGLDNVLTWRITSASAAPVITQAQLIIRQVNPGLGQSPSQVVPAYVNSAGVQIIP